MGMVAPMTWLLALGQRLLGLAPVRWAAAALAALVAVLAALGAARRSGRREGRSEVEAEQGRATIEAVRRRDEATRTAPRTGDDAIERLRRGDG